MNELQALTLDLDDTLWPIEPVLLRAEQVLREWMLVHAPATAARFSVAQMQQLRNQMQVAHPELLHDLSQLRRLTLQRALTESGDDPALTDAAFDVYFDARQQVVLYDDVEQALERLAARYRLLALSNGNADIQRVGLARFFAGSVNARTVGVAKPNPRIFQVACSTLALAPHQVMHVGDHWHMDVQGARAAGLHSVWLRRPDCSSVPEEAVSAAGPAGHHWTLADLSALADALGC